MPIRIVTKEVRYIYELSFTLEHSMPISSLAAPGLTANLQTFGHARRQCPPYTESAPFHKNACLRLSMHWMTHGEREIAKAVWNGMADSLALTNTVLPAFVSKFAFQGGSPVTILSTKGCNSDFLNFLTDKGIPKYLIGKGCWKR